MSGPWDPPPFVGRARELDDLRDAVRRGTSVLLVGGRRCGKTFLLEQIGDVGRAVCHADVGGWDRRSEESVLGELATLIQVEARTRAGMEAALRERAPLAIVLDEADLLLGEPWSRGLLQWMRYLDGNLRGGLSFVLAGGPVLDGWTDPDDRGSPPLNNAMRVHLDPLDDAAIVALVAHLDAQLSATERTLVQGRMPEFLREVGGHPWLLVHLCRLLGSGVDLDEVLGRLDDRCSHSYVTWHRQIGPGGARLLRLLRARPIAVRSFRQDPAYAAMRGDLLRCRYVGLVQREGDAWRVGAATALGSLFAGSTESYDLAISYAREDRDLAAAIKAGLPDYRVFFDLDEQTWLWGQSYELVFPGIYEVEARFVLVLATPDYMRKHWTRVEFDAAMRGRAGRVLVVDLGGLPPDMPAELLFLPGTQENIVKLTAMLRTRLGR